MNKLRPLLDLRTPLRLIPKEWLDLIEPRIIRPDDSSCWLWTGAVDGEGEPIISTKNLVTGRRSTMRVKRIIARMFWTGTDEEPIYHACGTRNCLHPAHFIFGKVSKEELKQRADRIRRWGRERT